MKLPSEQHFSAGGTLFRGDEVCLIRPSHRDRWQLPKGHIEPGEKPHEAAIREVLEETGHLGRVIGVKLEDVEYRHVEKRVTGSVQVQKKVSFFELALVKENERPLDAEEIAEARFFPVAEALRAIAFASERHVLESALQRRARRELSG